MKDQAEKLREIAHNLKGEIETEIKSQYSQKQLSKRIKTIVITSGKGGVGKSTLAVNLAICLSMSRKKVALVDGDLGLANIDIMLGITPEYSLNQLFSGQKKLAEIIVAGPAGLTLIPGWSGLEHLFTLNTNEIIMVIDEFEQLEQEFDFLIIDTGAGISKIINAFIKTADIVLLVTTPEPTSVADTFSALKNIVNIRGDEDIRLVINRVENKLEGARIAERLELACQKLLNLSIPALGYVANDPMVGEGVLRQQPVINLYPHTTASIDFKTIGQKLISDEAIINNVSAQSGLKGFLKRVFALVR